MATVKFNQSADNITVGIEYKITKSYNIDNIAHFHFKDNDNDDCIVRKVVGTDTDNFFEIMED
jgi:hypothetical protein